MLNRVLILLALSLFAASAQAQKIDTTHFIVNHSRIPDNVGIDSCDYYKQKYLSMRDTARLNGYRVGQVRYYLKLIQKHPNNAKYLRGWVTRAVR